MMPGELYYRYLLRQQWINAGCPIRPYFNHDERMNMRIGTLSGCINLVILEWLRFKRSVKQTIKPYIKKYIKR